MNTFIWKGKDAQGYARTERVAAENAQLAKTVLVAQGWTDLQLVTDEVCDIAAGMAKAETQDYETFQEQSAATEVNYFEGRFPSFWSQYAETLWESKGSILISVLLISWGIFKDRTWPLVTGAICLVVLLVLFPAIHTFFSLPTRYYNRLNRAKVWSRWDEVLRCVDRLRQVRSFTRSGVPDVELSRCRAQALAATGRLNEGLREFARYADHPDVPHWNYVSFVAGIYETAKEYERALVCRQQAAEEKPDTSVVWIDLAFEFVRGLNRPAEAREALARAEALEITTMGVTYLSFLRGLICWREGGLTEARGHFETALSGFKVWQHNPLLESVTLLTKAHLCAIHGALGEVEVARSYFRETEKFLVAAREKELLEECRKSLGV